jgi:hypothetical protein
MRALRVPLLLLVSFFLWAGCSRGTGPGAADEKTGTHKDVPPHGGIPVALGDDYNIELVRDPESGTLSGYVLDDEMEDFIRSSSPLVTMVATVNGRPQTLVLTAVANPATGEKVGDTSLFEGQADWLRTTGDFDAVLRTITIRGTTFTEVKFNYPRGNATD